MTQVGQKCRRFTIPTIERYKAKLKTIIMKKKYDVIYYYRVTIRGIRKNEEPISFIKITNQKVNIDIENAVIKRLHGISYSVESIVRLPELFVITMVTLALANKNICKN